MEERVTVRVLVPGDEAALIEFLSAHLETSLMLLSNIERAGLVDRGEPFQATYVASFDGAGAITAVAGHSWNGNVLLQGDVGLEQAALRAAEVSQRRVRGFLGAWAQVCRARRAFGLEAAPAAHDGAELLYALPLAELQVPELLSRSDVALRVPSAAEARDVLGGWRVGYHVEILGSVRTPELEQQAQREIDGQLATGRLWVLAVGDELVAMTAFNAEARGAVQVGGVFTAPGYRGRGYARAAVAASLQLARARGATRSFLFTGENKRAAQRAYTALGFRVIGDYGLVLF
ncbi:MAG TPA: GNAT family N-acetyltransferase [Polyangiaceae bacterium]|nr:GNAT family N-acetyltransferase [Polyangiaceae bacterium]